MLFAEIADKLSDFDNLLRIKTYCRLIKNDYNAMVRVGAVILDMQSGNETLEDMFQAYLW